MKHLNFLSKSGSQSCGHRVTTLASTVGSPSAHRRGTMLRLLSVLVLVLTFGVGNVWGASNNATYTVSSRTSVSKTGTAPTGSSAAFSQSGTNDAGQMTANGTTTLTLSGYAGKRITGISVSIKKTSGSKTAAVSATTGSTKFVDYTISSNNLPTNFASRTVTLSSTPTISANTTIVISIKASAKSVYVQSYTITWEDAASYDVSFNTGTGNPPVSKRSGSSITLPSASDLVPTCSGDGWELYGWATETYGSASTTAAPTTTFAGLAGASYSPSDDITLYAVYKKTVSNGSGTSDVTFTHDNSGGWTTESSVAQTGTIDGVTISTTAGTHNLSNSDLRVNKSATFTVSSSSTISSIAFTSSNYDWSAVSEGSYSSKTWTGSANSVTFTAGNGQVRMTEIVVTIAGSSTSYYWNAPTCTPPCTELGSINGSVSWSNPTTAVVTWNKLDDQVSSWALSWSPNTDGSSITSAIADKGETQKTATVSGLACGTDYTFTLTPTIKSGVCTVETNPTIVSSYPKPTITLDKVGTTNGDFSISGDLTSQCPGENVTVLLSPNSGYEVDALTIGETDYASSVSNNSYTFEMPSTNVTIHATFKTSVKPEVNVTATEGLTGTTLSYGNVAKETDKALTITVTGSNLTNDVTWALADTDDESAGMFSISPSSTTIGQSAATSGQALEITFTPAAAKTYTATLTFSTTGAAADKVITLTGTGKNLYTVTFKCDGQVFDTKQAFDGETVTFPENPSKFDNDYPNFIGWADAISGIATSAPTLKSASDAITANAEYHAVFSSTPVATGNYAKITTLGELTDGKYVIVGEASSKLAILESEVYSNFYVKGTALTLSEGKVANPAAASVLDFEHSEAGWSINYNATGGGYLVIKDGTGDHINLVPNQESAHYYSAQVTAGGVWTLASTTKTGSQIKYKLYTKNNNEYPEFTVESSDKNPIYLFKQEFTQEFVTRQIVKHTISYNKNTEDEVTGSLPANATIVDGEDYTVSDATLTRTGYNFIGWNTDNTATTAQTTLLNVTADATLYAVWEAIPTYDIEFSVNGAKVEALKLANQLEGTAIVFPDAAAITAASAFPTTDKKFVGWIEASSYASDDAPTFVTSATAAADKTYYAVFADVEEDAVECTYNTASTCYISNWSNIERGAKASNDEAWQMYGYSNAQNPEGKICTNASYANLLSLKLNARTGSNSTTLTISYRADENAEWTQLSTKEISTNQTYNNYSISLTGIPSGAQYIRIMNSTNSFYIRSITLTSGSVSDYVTNIAPLSSIAITAAPTKTVYKKGEELDLTGMVVKATYGTGVGAREKTLASDKYTVDLAETALETTNTEFEVSYTENAVAKKATQAIKVFALDKIEITAAPATTIYLEGASFDKTGMVVEATWGTDGDKIVETLDAEDYTVTPSVLDATSITSVTISYTHEDVTQTTNQAVTVNVRPSLTMSWKVGNADPTETKIYEEGGKYLLVLPAEDPDPVAAGFTSDYVFKGWTTATSVEKDGSDFTNATAGTEMSNDEDFYAVFALASEGESAIFTETFNDCAGTGGNDDKWSGSIASSNVNTDNSGWSTTSVGGADKCIKIGAGSTQGSAQTPEMSLTGSATLTFKAAAWSGDATTLNLSASGATLSRSSVTLKDAEWDDYEIAITNATGSVRITFQGKQKNSARFFLDEVVVTKNVTNYSNYRFAPSNVAAPVIGLTDGTYYGAQNVEITADKAIYYTLDGTNPTNASTPYSNAINLNEAGTKTIKAVAYDSESDDYSAIVSAEYTIVTEIDAPTMPATGKFYEDSKEVTIEHALTAEGAKIYYSYDNAAYSEYSEALEITETKTVWAYATIGSLKSEKVSATYTKGETVTYTKLTSADQLAAGMEFVLVAEYQSGFYGAGALNSTYLEKVNLSAPVANVLSVNDEAVAVFTLDGEPAVWTMSSDAGTLYSEDNKNVNYSNTGNGTWNLTFSNSVLTIANNGENNGNLRYNGSSPRFTTYSGQTTVDIYYKEYATAYTLTYDVDGTENDKTVKVVEGYEYTIVNNVFGDAPEGGINAYWKDANNNLYTVGDKIILTSNMTLTPVWSQVVRSSLAEGKMGTICPKQEVKYPTGASFYELTYKTIKNGVPYKVFFDEIAEGASLVAGKPYLFVADGESITGVKVGDEATEGVNDYNGFHGILNPANTTLSVTADDAANYKYYIITNNEIRLCGAGTFTIPVERAYIDMSALSAEQVAPSPGRRRVCLTNRAAETVTGVDELNASEAPVKVMIDGLLFIIRGEKMYNANGQVVK